MYDRCSTLKESAADTAAAEVDGVLFDFVSVLRFFCDFPAGRSVVVSASLLRRLALRRAASVEVEALLIPSCSLIVSPLSMRME